MPSVAAMRARGCPTALARSSTSCLRKRKRERIATRGRARRAARAAPARPRAAASSPRARARIPASPRSRRPTPNRFFGRDARHRAHGRARPRAAAHRRRRSVGRRQVVVRARRRRARAQGSGERWDVVTLRPGRQPLAALASVVQRLTTRPRRRRRRQVAEHDQLMQRLRAEPGFLGTLLRSRARADERPDPAVRRSVRGALHARPRRRRSARAFTAALAGVADDAAAPLRVVVSMRSDFLDRVAEDPRFLDELTRGLVFLQPPDRDGLREALVAAGRDGRLPLRERRRWSRTCSTRSTARRARCRCCSSPRPSCGTRAIASAGCSRVASYDAIGGITGALATHADDVVAQHERAARRS